MICKVCNSEHNRPRSKFCSNNCCRRDYYRRNKDIENKKRKLWKRTKTKEQEKQCKIRWRASGGGAFERMRARCCNPCEPSFKNYGGKGVRCKLSLKQFRDIYFSVDICQLCDKKLIGESTTDRRTIDRIDSNGHYDVNNVRIICKSCNSSRRRKFDSEICDLIRSQVVVGDKNRGIAATAIRYNTSEVCIRRIVKG